MKTHVLALLLWLTALSFRVAGFADAGLSDFRNATGCDAWHGVRSQRTDGVHSGDGLGGRFSETVDVRGGRFVEREHDAAFTSAEGFDGRTSWTQSFGGGSHVLNAPSARAIARSRAWLRDRGWCVASPSPESYSVEQLHNTSSHAAIVLRIVPHDGAPITASIDPVTHLLDRTIVQMDEYRVIDDYDDWRLVDGIPIAFTHRIVVPEDDSTTIYRARRIIITRRPIQSTTMFARPSLPSDVRMTANANVVSIPYLVENDKTIVNVRVNGAGPFPFVLDSGAHLILTAQTARRLALFGTGSASSVNENRVTKTGFVRIRQLEIGGASIRDQVAKIEPYGFAKLERGSRPPKAGWLGLEFFERFAVTLDGVRHRLTLRPLTRRAPRPAGDALPLLFADDAPLVACSLAMVPGLCMLDTGNAGSTIVMRRWAAHHHRDGVLAHGVRIGDQAYSREPIALGAQTRPRELVEFPTTDAADDEPSTTMAAILSEHMIDGFITTFDYGRGRVYLQRIANYRAERFTRTGVIAAKQPDGTFTVEAVMPQCRVQSGTLAKGDVIVAVDGIAASRLSGGDFRQLNGVLAARSVTYRVRRNNDVRSVRVLTQTLLPS